LKLVAISDIHGNTAALNDAKKVIEKVKPDVVVVCGDITHTGDADDAVLVLRNIEGLAPILYVWGNMDHVSRDLQLPLKDARCIHGQLVTLSGVDFLGLSARYDPSILTKFSRGSNPMVVVSHEPPYRCCDKAWSGLHAGSKPLREFVEAQQPELVFCGHIHESRGKCTLGDTIVVNVGKCSQGVAVATIGKGQVSVELVSY